MKGARADIDFGLSVVPTYETGVFLGINAIENSLIVMNSPRCSFVRGMKVFLHNDIASTMYSATGLHRLITTEWMTFEDVCGDEQTFTALLEKAAHRFEDFWVFTFQNVSSFVSGFDLSGLTELVSRSAKRVLIPVDGPRLDLDWTAGYDEVASKVLSNVLNRKGRPVELALVGHVLSRNEADEAENVREIRRLLSDIGLEETAVFLSGGVLESSGIGPSHVAVMDHATERSRKVVEAYGAEYSDVGLPLGIEGTAAWLKAVGELTGRQAVVSRCVDRELSELVPDIQWVVTEHLLGRKAAVVGDAHLGRALVRFLQEMGMEVAALFNVSFTRTEPPDCRVVDNPSPEAFRALIGESEVDVVVGSGVFKYLLTGENIPYVELGFPSYLTHALYPKPYLGFRGARYIVDSLFNAILNRDERQQRKPD